MADFDDLEQEGEDSFEAYLSRRAASNGETTEEPAAEEPADEPVDATVDDEVTEANREEFEEPIIVDVEDKPAPNHPRNKQWEMVPHPDPKVPDDIKPLQEMREVKTRRFHEMTGPYIYTEMVPVQNYSWRCDVWNNTYHLAIDEMTADQIEKVIEENEEAIAKIRTQSHALQAAKEEKLLEMDPAEREAYLARRAKSKPRLKKVKEEDSKELTRTKSGSVRPRNKVEKAILTFKNMDLSKEELREEAKVLNYLNPDTEEFINALYDKE